MVDRLGFVLGKTEYPSGNVITIKKNLIANDQWLRWNNIKKIYL